MKIDFFYSIVEGQTSRRTFRECMVIAAHVYSQSQRSHQGVTGLLNRNRIFDGGKSGLIEGKSGDKYGIRVIERGVGRWRGKRPPELSVTGWIDIAEAVTSHMHCVRL
ncbi:hypothetical protein EVAR_20056_1 [Eumeta japonica]|uniref:Uncharacterized protein n=1 Tax=Eumeta variegata TaxID=151549 RepID=A0A4C1UJ93_EUMVA|nr:hypothetical protein EVAR_20056_1 [Eumeta japonica]